MLCYKIKNYLKPSVANLAEPIEIQKCIQTRKYKILSTVIDPLEQCQDFCQILNED